jgi:hypothetical protein
MIEGRSKKTTLYVAIGVFILAIILYLFGGMFTDKTCGGLTGTSCPKGFYCHYASDLPLMVDGSGHCRLKFLFLFPISY